MFAQNDSNDHLTILALLVSLVNSIKGMNNAALQSRMRNSFDGTTKYGSHKLMFAFNVFKLRLPMKAVIENVVCNFVDIVCNFFFYIGKKSQRQICLGFLLVAKSYLVLRSRILAILRLHSANSRQH